LKAHLKNIDGGAEVLGAELEQGGNPGQEAHQGRGGLRRVVQQRQPQLQTVLPQRSSFKITAKNIYNSFVKNNATRKERARPFALSSFEYCYFSQKIFLLIPNGSFKSNKSKKIIYEFQFMISRPLI
jgi:hypothetical protein